MSPEMLGLGITWKGRVYNKQTLSPEEQRQWVEVLLMEIFAVGGKVSITTYGGNAAFMLYKYISLTGGHRLVDRYDEGDVLATVYKMYLDRFLEPDGYARQENFRAAIGRSA